MSQQRRTPTIDENNFAWAVGVEDTFIPQGRPGLRPLDEYELTQHYPQWRTDFDLLAETGARFARWGIPWYRVQPAPDHWDWAWTDEALDTLVNVKGITPILDLMHYGTPLWLENSFLNASYPQRVAEYAAQVAQRYGSLVQFYTPLNEPMVNAEFCGLRGLWPPYLEGEDGLVKLLLAVARGIVLTTQALRRVQPGCTLVQVEALWHFEPEHEDLREQVEENNARQWLSFDLTTGRVQEDYPLLGWLRRHGVREDDLAWFRDNAVQYDIFGANFYPWSYGRLYRRLDGKVRRRRLRTDGRAIAQVLQQVWTRYQMPMMVTETSSTGGLAARKRWMDETVEAVITLRQEGLPVWGYTWFPFMTMIDWAYRTGRRPLSSYLLHLGLYDSIFDEQGILRRAATPLVVRYQQHTMRL